MSLPKKGLGAFVVFLAGASCAATGVSASVEISSAPTQNMACSSGACVPTASDAVLNADDLTAMLASGNATVSTTGSGVEALDIRVSAPVTWKTGSLLALAAQRSIVVASAVTVLGGGGGMSVTAASRQGVPSLFFRDGGNLTFSRLNAPLTINGARTTLEGTLAQLARDVVAHPGHAYALAHDYDARQDPVYSTSLITIPFSGSFSGLGHTISGLRIVDTANASVGVFSTVLPGAWVGNVGIVKIAAYGELTVGGLVGLNQGIVSNAYVTGIVRGGTSTQDGFTLLGGLVGHNIGSIVNCRADARVVHGYGVGGLVGENEGTVDSSFATGAALGTGYVGGLVGWNSGNPVTILGAVTNSYATAAAKGQENGHRPALVGGLVGWNPSYNGQSSTIAASYSTGIVKGKTGSVGGFAGDQVGVVTSSYWDTTASGTSRAVGEGDATGITGLTTAELQSGLPAGFDPAIWGRDPSIDGGYPYLLANPPPQ